MPLAEYIPKREKVTFGDGEKDFFEVRGISTPDVALLIDLHEGTISTIVATVYEHKEAFGSENEKEVQAAVQELISSLVYNSPILISNLIAICADEESAMQQASQLPITVQVEALTKIADLTFKDLASVKKLAADVMKLIRGIVPPANPRRRKK